MVSRLPLWLKVWFGVTFAGISWLVGRLVWEQTILTWRHGLQMVGFTLVHTELHLYLGALLSGLLFALAYLVVLGISIVDVARGRRVAVGRWLALVLSAAVVSLLFVPYSTWQRLFVTKLANGPRAAEFLTYAAAVGDLPTVERFLDHGVSINAKNRDGSTALYGASVEGQMAVIRYLLAHGADPNIRNTFGSTALGAAREMKHPEAARYLQAHGAHQ